MDLASRLAELTAAVSIHKGESAVALALERQWGPFLDENHRDRLGNFVGLARGGGPEPAPSVLAAAHMDGVGLMVTHVTEGGFLRVLAVGTADLRLLLGQEVEVLAKGASADQRDAVRLLTGVVGAKPPHLTTAEERKKVPPIEDLYVDLGLPEDEVKALVRPGTPVLYRQELLILRNGRAAGRYLDDTAGLAAIGVALQELDRLRSGEARGDTETDRRGPADFYAVGTAGEETGGFPGARTAAYSIRPDVAIALDVTFADFPGEKDPNASFPMDGGPTIGVGPNCHPVLCAFLKETAAEAGLTFRVEVLPGHSGTDAWAMQTARGGIPTAVISIPLRYMHTPVETVSLGDIRDAGRLLALAVARTTPDLVRRLARGGE